MPSLKAGVGTALDARELTSGYRLYWRHHPDVVIVDLAMQGSGLGGLDLSWGNETQGR